MSPPAKKRKISPPLEEEDSSGRRDHVSAANPLQALSGSASPANLNSETKPASQQGQGNDQTAESDDTNIPEPEKASATDQTSTTDTSNPTIDRLARFAALKKRATASSRSNLSEAKAEAQRAAIDPTVLANLSRRSAIAQHNLLKADTEEAGGTGAFERKRAWDYTIEESERWDERMAQKKANRDKNAFQDYGAEAAKIYERQIRELEKQGLKDGGRGREEYQRQKAELIEQAARNGGLEIVEMDNGELIAIDRDGRFYADSGNTGFVEQRPKKENIDRLVDDLKKAEEVRLRKRKERRGDVDEGDVTYINEKNKQFNLKLARFYDRYTTEIRESFERGTAI